jgi:CBS domain-containing protein
VTQRNCLPQIEEMDKGGNCFLKTSQSLGGLSVDQYYVKDLMVPLSEYATVTEGATLFEAVLALEKAQEEFDHTKYRHRAVLVLDKERRVIGKVGQMTVLQALEPQAEDLENIKALSQFGFSNQYVWDLRGQRKFQKGSLKDFCANAAKIKVEEIMQKPSEGEFIEQNEILENAVHQIVQGRLLSLLVTDGKDIVGILRMSDAFAAIFHVMKECEGGI